MFKVFIVIFAFVLLTFIMYLIIQKKECFEQQLIITENNKNVKGSMDIDQPTYKQILSSIRGQANRNNIILYVDPYIDYYIFNNRKNKDEYTDGIFVCLTSKKMRKCDCIWDLENKTIAYIYTSDFLILQALIKGYRLNGNKINIIQISRDDLYLSYDMFDMCLTYVVIGSEYMKYILNSQYYINGFKDVDINRLMGFYPFLINNVSTMRNYFDDDLMKHYIDDQNVLIPIMRYKIIKNMNIFETFITRLEMPEDYLGNVHKKIDEYNANAIDYGCYGNMTINNKYECDSLYNYDGTPKKYYSMWDKRCEKNEDCPYFKSNTNYPNQRGGCKDGYCEFPVGVKRLGFTKYDDNGLNTPLCYDCSDTTELNCCKNSKKPDYVFADDFNDRVKYDLNTVIAPLQYE